jgi:hypothetical protein
VRRTSIREDENNAPRIPIIYYTSDREQPSSKNEQTQSTYSGHGDTTTSTRGRIPGSLAIIRRGDGYLRKTSEWMWDRRISWGRAYHVSVVGGRRGLPGAAPAVAWELPFWRCGPLAEMLTESFRRWGRLPRFSCHNLEHTGEVNTLGLAAPLPVYRAGEARERAYAVPPGCMARGKGTGKKR